MKNTYEQLCLKYQKALQPIWKIYTYDPDDCYDTIDGPQRIFMDSYELCEDIYYAFSEEDIPAANKSAIQTFVELRNILDKMGSGPSLSLSITRPPRSKTEYQAAWNRYYAKVIPVMQELLKATPPFVRAMYAYNGKIAPASI